MSLGPALMLTFFGVAMMAAGLDFSHRIEGWRGQVLSLLSPLGVFVAAAGAVSLIVPDFF